MKDDGVDWTGAREAARPPRVIILVTDEGDSSHGEIKEYSDAEEASQAIESLLESGYEQARIRAFTGDESEITVAYRPVVTIAGTTTAAMEGRLSDHMPKVGSEEAA